MEAEPKAVPEMVEVEPKLGPKAPPQLLEAARWKATAPSPVPPSFSADAGRGAYPKLPGESNRQRQLRLCGTKRRRGGRSLEFFNNKYGRKQKSAAALLLRTD